MPPPSKRGSKAFALTALRDPRAILACVYALMWVGGVVAYSVVGHPPADMPWAGCAFLTLAGVLVVSTTRPQELAPVCIASLLGFASEVAGVVTGAIYGRYHYTAALGPKVWDVPLVMLAAWLVLTAYVLGLSRQWCVSWKCGVPLAAAWMTCIDLVIDPLAANTLNFWKWETAGNYYGVPVRNFVGWYAVSLLIFALIWHFYFHNAWARWMGLSVLAFFWITAMSLHYAVPALVGLALIGMDLGHNRLILWLGPFASRGRPT